MEKKPWDWGFHPKGKLISLYIYNIGERETVSQELHIIYCYVKFT